MAYGMKACLTLPCIPHFNLLTVEGMRTYLLLRGCPRRGLPVAASGRGTAKRWKRCCTTGDCAENLNSRQNTSSANIALGTSHHRT